MGLLKTWLRSDAALTILSALAAGYIRLIHATQRWEVVNADVPRRLWAERRPFVGCFWHGRTMQMKYIWKTELPLAMLISRHRDGRLIARTIERLGVSTIEGSTAKAGTSKGGAGALLNVVRALKSGTTVGITPDGPRGPRMRASPGALAAARLAGVPLVPISYAVSRRMVMGSWDRFVVPLPFGRGVHIWGDPIDVPADCDDAALARIMRRLEDEMIRVTDEADRMVGCPTIAPAEPAESWS